MCTGNSDYCQRPSTSLSISSTNSWVDRKSKRISFISLECLLCGLLPSMKKSILQTWMISFRWVRTNSLDRKYLRWKRRFSRDWTSRLLLLAPTDSFRGSDVSQSPSMTMRSSILLNIFRKFLFSMQRYWSLNRHRSQPLPWSSHPSNSTRKTDGTRKLNRSLDTVTVISRNVSQRSSSLQWKSIRNSSKLCDTSSQRVSTCKCQSTNSNSDHFLKTDMVL